MFEAGVVRAIEGLIYSRSGGIIGISCRFKSTLGVLVRIASTSDSNEYTQYTISQYKKENAPKLSQTGNYGIWSKGPKNEFETAVVNGPSLLEPLKIYCNMYLHSI